MIKYDVVNVLDIIEEVAGKALRHFNEKIEPNEESRPSVDWDYILDLGRAQVCVAVTARKDGALIGYSVYHLSGEIFHKNRIIANNIAIYVQKEHRGKVTKELMRLADEKLKESGAIEVNYTFNNKRIAPFMAQQGFEPNYTIWSKHYG